MDYVFVFVGEFGVELLNWQGAVRKFHKMLSPGDRVVCCSRASLYPIYEFADAYVDISNVASFQHSRAMAYFALPDPTSSWDSVSARRFNEQLKADLEAHIQAQLEAQDFWRQVRTAQEHLEPLFVFSSDRNELNGVRFGRIRHGPAGALLITLYEQIKRAAPGHLGAIEQFKRTALETFRSLDLSTDASIYELLEVDNNNFVRIRRDDSILPAVAGKLGWDPCQPFVLCQTRQRGTMQRSPDLLPAKGMQQLLTLLGRDIRIVLLSFQTGRWLDSYSTFDELPNCTVYHCHSFPEQAALASHARHCLFFTEGDFGSHIYVPPFLGRDVTAIAPASVYQLGTTPIDFWNQHVFTFGGQIHARTAEDVFACETSIKTLTAAILAIATAGQPAVAEPKPSAAPAAVTANAAE